MYVKIISFTSELCGTVGIMYLVYMALCGFEEVEILFELPKYVLDSIPVE